MKTKYAPKSVEDSDWSPLFKLAVDDLKQWIITMSFYLESTEEEQKKI